MNFEEMINKIHCADCLEFIKNIPDNSIDLIVTDPPYGIKYISNHSKNEEYRKKVADTTSWDKFDRKLTPISEFIRIMKDNTHCYVFSRWDCIYDLPKPSRVLIWNKNDNGMGDLSDWGMGHEIILLYKKGRRILPLPRVPDVLNFWKVANFKIRDNNKNKMFHPTEKPIELIKMLIEKASNNGDIILDPFLGSGTTAVAAKMLGRRFIGIEKERNYCDIAERRISNITKRLDNFILQQPIKL